MSSEEDTSVVNSSAEDDGELVMLASVEDVVDTLDPSEDSLVVTLSLCTHFLGLMIFRFSAYFGRFLQSTYLLRFI